MKERKNYLDKKEFYEAIKKYLAAKNKDKVKKEYEYIGGALMKIAEGLASMKNFKNYQFKDDMVMDAVMNCIRYLGSFDPEKSDNPFGYFTRVIMNSFFRKIELEKKALYTKLKALHHEYDLHQLSQSGEIINLENDKGMDFMEKFEQSQAAKKAKILEKALNKKEADITDIMNED